MSVDQLPEHEEAIRTFEERTPIATMISGGAVVAVIVYFVVGWSLGTFGLDLPLVQWAGALLVIGGSIWTGLSPASVIKINRKTGYIEASASGLSWSGWANEPERFMVLERTIEGRGGQRITEYKLNVMITEEDQFDVNLTTENARDAIKWVEDAKNAISGVSKSEQMIQN